MRDGPHCGSVGCGACTLALADRVRHQRGAAPPRTGENSHMPASAINVRELQGPLKARYQEEPEAARITLRVRSNACDLTDPLHCAMTPEAVPGTVWRSGAHPGVGGVGDVPCSGDLLLGALA